MVSAYTGSVFSAQEYQRRLKATQKAIAERGAEAALIHQPEHIFYLTGFPGPGAGYGPNQVCILPAKGDPIVVLRKMEEEPFLATSWVTDYASWHDYQSATGLLKRVMEERGLGDKTIAVEYDSWALTHARFNKIKVALPKAKFIDFSRVLWYLRQRKSPEEIVYIRRAAEIGVKALKASIEAVAPGRMEREIQKVIRDVYDEEGADSGSGLTVNSGGNIRFVHASPSQRVLQKGDVVNTEVTPRVHNYHGRVMRSTIIGQPTKEQQKIARIVEEAQREAIGLMKPGAVAKDVDGACREKINKAVVRGEWETPYYNVTGYTLGIILPPWVSDFSRCFLPKEEWVLEEGMVFHMYSWAQGLSFSESVLVTGSGHEILTKGIERELFVK